MSSSTVGRSAVPAGSTAVLDRVRVALAVVLTVGVVVVMAAVIMRGEVRLLVVIGSTVAVGAVICWKRPDERVGWLLVVAGLLFGVSSVAFWSVEVVNTSAPPPSAALFGAWVDEWAWIPMLGLTYVVLPMLLPDGRPASPAFGRLLRLIVAVMAVWTVTAMFSAQLADEPAASLPGVANPVGLLPLDDVEDPPTGGYLRATAVVFFGIAAVSVVVRYRQSIGRERIQLRWIACGTVATIVGFVAVAAAQLPQTAIDWLHAVVIPLMPLSIGVAVLRHNLRHRPVDLEDGRVRDRDRGACGDLRPARSRRPDGGRRAWRPGGRGIDAGGGGAVQPCAPAGATRGRPQVQPRPLRRDAHHRGVRRAATYPVRRWCADRGLRNGRGRDHAADHSIALAADANNKSRFKRGTAPSVKDVPTAKLNE